MQTILAARASTILYSLLVNQQPGNPWLLPANICPIVPITFRKAQVPFEFVDISAGTLHMDLEQAEALIRRRSFGGLLYAHTYGEASTPNEFFDSLKSISPETILIDDRCLCLPDLTVDSASNADVQLHSTGYAKIVELNFGGYAFIQDHISYQPADLPFKPQHHDEVEQSYKQAIAQRSKFVYQDSDWLATRAPGLAWDDYAWQIETNLTRSLAHRARLNEVYARYLPAEIQLPAGFQTWRFNIRVKNKRHILDRIFAAGLFASSHYASLAGIMDDHRAQNAEALAASVINLFNDHHFTLSQAEQVCKIILENLA